MIGFGKKPRFLGNKKEYFEFLDEHIIKRRKPNGKKEAAHIRVSYFEKILKGILKRNISFLIKSRRVKRMSRRSKKASIATYLKVQIRKNLHDINHHLI